MRCNLSKKRLLEYSTLYYDEVLSRATFLSYKKESDEYRKHLEKTGYDSIKAAFISGYITGSLETQDTIKSRLLHYFKNLAKSEIKKVKKACKELVNYV